MDDEQPDQQPPPPSPPPPPPPPPPPKRNDDKRNAKHGLMYVVIAFAVVAVVLSALGVTGDSGSDDEMGGDPSARQACVHFHNVAADYTDDQLTFTELRDKLKEVEDKASVSDTPGISSAARDMVAAVTNTDEAALTDAVNRMGDACDRINV